MKANADVAAFGPDSLSWQLSSEMVMVLGARRALLLQVAHPLVAQGVADHSNFEADRLGRLFRTLEASLSVVFGTKEEATEVIRRINAVHRTVRGRLQEDAGVWARGIEYRADDPELLLWVHATLVDTAVTFYERFVRKLDDRELETYYDETRWPTAELGIPDELVPNTYVEFRAYFDEMLASGKIFVGSTARDISRGIMYPGIAFIPDRWFDPANIITIGTLPEEIRASYGFRWNRGRAAGLSLVTAAVSRSLPLLPSRIRYLPHSRRRTESA